jgi:Stress responsive A/B Barrel Domain
MLRHAVVFRLRRPISQADHDALVNGLTDFAADPPFATGPAQVEASLHLRGESPRTGDVLLTVEFPNADAFPEYINHPHHIALVTDVLEPLCEGWWSVQYEN